MNRLADRRREGLTDGLEGLPGDASTNLGRTSPLIICRKVCSTPASATTTTRCWSSSSLAAKRSQIAATLAPRRIGHGRKAAWAASLRTVLTAKPSCASRPDVARILADAPPAARPWNGAIGRAVPRSQARHRLAGQPDRFPRPRRVSTEGALDLGAWCRDGVASAARGTAPLALTFTSLRPWRGCPSSLSSGVREARSRRSWAAEPGARLAVSAVRPGGQRSWMTLCIPMKACGAPVLSSEMKHSRA